MKKQRFILNEEDGDELLPVDDLELELPPVELDEPVGELVPDEVLDEPAEEVVTHAYSDIAQDVLRKQWDVINACDGLIATLTDDEGVSFSKDDVLAVLKKITDETTQTIGMTTKALGVIDPSQEELMQAGIEDAEEVLSDSEEVPEEEPEGDDELDESMKSGVAIDSFDYFADWVDTVMKNDDFRNTLKDDNDIEVFDILVDYPDAYNAFVDDIADQLCYSNYINDVIDDFIETAAKDYIRAYGDEILKSAKEEK